MPCLALPCLAKEPAQFTRLVTSRFCCSIAWLSLARFCLFRRKEFQRGRDQGLGSCSDGFDGFWVEEGGVKRGE